MKLNEIERNKNVNDINLKDGEAKNESSEKKNKQVRKGLKRKNDTVYTDIEFKQLSSMHQQTEF